MINTNFYPFPLLTTDRLILRSLETPDGEEMFKQRNDDIVNIYLENFRHESIEHTYAMILRVQSEIRIGTSILWILTEKGKNKFMGTICLWNISVEEEKAEAGYILNPEYHRKGYMNEALIKVLDFGFNKMKLKMIDAYTHEKNEGSIKLLLKNKFIQEKPQKEAGSNRVYFWLSNEEHQLIK